MHVHIKINLGSGNGGGVFGTWSRVLSASGITYADNDTTAFNPTVSTRLQLGTEDFGTGKVYWEQLGYYRTTSASSNYMGFADHDGLVINTNHAYLQAPICGLAGNGHVYLGTTSQGYKIAYPFNGQRAMFALDFASTKFWVGVNGVWDGDPSAGTGGYTTSILSGNVRIVGQSYGGADNYYQTLYTSDADFIHTKPTGFSSLSGS